MKIRVHGIETSLHHCDIEVPTEILEMGKDSPEYLKNLRRTIDNWLHESHGDFNFETAENSHYFEVDKWEPLDG